MNSKSKNRLVFALLKAGQVYEREHRLAVASWIVCRDVMTFSDMSDVEYQMMADVLSGWQKNGDIVAQCQRFAP